MVRLPMTRGFELGAYLNSEVLESGAVVTQAQHKNWPSFSGRLHIRLDAKTNPEVCKKLASFINAWHRTTEYGFYQLFTTTTPGSQGDAIPPRASISIGSYCYYGLDCRKLLDFLADWSDTGYIYWAPSNTAIDTDYEATAMPSWAVSFEVALERDGKVASLVYYGDGGG